MERTTRNRYDFNPQAKGRYPRRSGERKWLMDTHKYIITARSSLRRGQKKKKKSAAIRFRPLEIFWNPGNRARLFQKRNPVFGSEMEWDGARNSLSKFFASVETDGRLLFSWQVISYGERYRFLMIKIKIHYLVLFNDAFTWVFIFKFENEM